MTLETLKKFGADTQDGLTRCMNNEAFYLKLVSMGIADERFETLKPVLDSKDYNTAFEMAHALKGALTNLSLTPICEPCIEMTELLRDRKDMDYTELYNKMKSERDRLLEMEKAE